jgi:hypothetical protein
MGKQPQCGPVSVALLTTKPGFVPKILVLPGSGVLQERGAWRVSFFFFHVEGVGSLWLTREMGIGMFCGCRIHCLAAQSCIPR